MSKTRGNATNLWGEQQLENRVVQHFYGIFQRLSSWQKYLLCRTHIPSIDAIEIGSHHSIQKPLKRVPFSFFQSWMPFVKNHLSFLNFFSVHEWWSNASSATLISQKIRQKFLISKQPVFCGWRWDTNKKPYLIIDTSQIPKHCSFLWGEKGALR